MDTRNLNIILLSSSFAVDMDIHEINCAFKATHDISNNVLKITNYISNNVFKVKNNISKNVMKISECFN